MYDIISLSLDASPLDILQRALCPRPLEGREHNVSQDR